MDYIVELLRANPIIPIFLTLGIGFWVGRLKYKSFSLGVVASTLLVGVIIGQLNISIPPLVKTIFFTLFLFSIGYSVGPQFFRALRGHGLKQICFGVLEALICAATVICAAKIMGYDTGEALGLFAGAETASASLGVISETVKGLDIAASQKDAITTMMPVCYAVTYIFGTIGSAWILSNVGPMLLGGLKKVKAECEEIEAQQGITAQPAPGMETANPAVRVRAFVAECDFFDKPRTISEVEEYYKLRKLRLFILRIRVNGKIEERGSRRRIRRGDELVLSGRSETIIEAGNKLGKEVHDEELLDFHTETLPVTIANKDVADHSIGDLRKKEFMHGVIIRSLSRNNMQLPVASSTVLHTGDVLELIGLSYDVNSAAAEIGFSEHVSNATDMVLVGLGIAIGCFIGVFSWKIGGIPVSLSTSGGALFAGLFLGWFRNKRPTFGYIPSPVIWFLDNIGLNMFIAVVGLSAGPSFLTGLKSVGVMLFVVGVLCTLIPLIVCILLGNKVFKFSGPETLGCVAGARCGVASIGAIQDTLESTVPAVGYTVTYAVANFVLVFCSLFVLFIV